MKLGWQDVHLSSVEIFNKHHTGTTLHLPQTTSYRQNNLLLPALHSPSRGVHTDGGARSGPVATTSKWTKPPSPPLLSLYHTCMHTHTHHGLHTDWIGLGGCVLFNSLMRFYLWYWPPEGGQPGKGHRGSWSQRWVNLCTAGGGPSSPPLHCLNDWILFISKRKNSF